jgi:hypothetical protein
LSIVLIAPLWGDEIYFQSHEYLGVLQRIVGIHEAVTSGQYPPQVLPNLTHGLGSGWMIFYPPIAYWVAAFPTLFSVQPIAAAKIAHAIMFALSGWTMYRALLNLPLTPWAAGAGGVLYMTAPYHLIDFYVRNAFAETFAFVWIPVVFAGIHKIIYQTSTHRYVTLSVGLAGLFLTHLISALYALLFASLYAAILLMVDAAARMNLRRLLAPIGRSMLLGSLLVAFFFLPFLEHAITGKYPPFLEQFRSHFVFSVKLINALTVDPSDILATGVSLSRDTIGALGHAHLGPQMPYTLGLHLVALALVGVATHRRSAAAGASALLAVLTTVMVTPYFNWEWMPTPFHIIQFPWRLLVYATFFLCVLAAMGLDSVFAVRQRTVALTLGAMALGYYLLTALATVTPTFVSREAMLNADTFSLQGTTGGGEHFPLGYFLRWRAQLPFDASLVTPTATASVSARIEAYRRNGSVHTFRVESVETQAPVTVRLPALFYLGYRLHDADGRAMPRSRVTHCDAGLVCATVTAGQYTLRYVATRWARVGNTLSVIGLIWLAYCALAFRREQRR